MSIIGLSATVIYLFPVYWMIVTSLKRRSELFANPPTLWPLHPVLDGYRRAVEVNALGYIRNSLIIALFVTILTVALATVGSYAMTRIKSKWAKWSLMIFLVAQMIPSVLLVTPIYVIFRNLNLLNTYVGVIIADTTLTLPLAVIIMRTAMLQVPLEIEEAARIDGASFLQLLPRIVTPMVRPGLIVVATISFLNSFGEFVYAVSLINLQNMYPATAGLYVFTTGLYGQEWNSAMAYSTMLVIPILIIFVVFQKSIVKGITSGALK